MQKFEAVIREIVPEAPQTVTVRLEPQGPFEYRAGQFLSIDPFEIAATRDLAHAQQVARGRRERPRAYSLSSAPHEPLVSITVKEEAPGEFPAVLSPWLTHEAKAGDALPFTGFNGLYALPDELPADAHVVHVCAGSGIVPNFGMLKDALHRALPQRHTVLFSNRSWLDAIFADDLRQLADAHPERLRVVHALTRDPAAPAGVEARASRIGADLIREVVPELGHAWFFACGPSVSEHERRAARARKEPAPPRFLECVRALLLEELGVEKARVYTEGW